MNWEGVALINVAAGDWHVGGASHWYNRIAIFLEACVL